MIVQRGLFSDTVIFGAEGFTVERHTVHPPATHTHDPATSHEAEEAITESGQRERHRDAVLRAIRHRPDSTNSEIAAWLGWPGNEGVCEVRKRMSDLRNDKLVDVVGKRLAAGRRRAESEWRAK